MARKPLVRVVRPAAAALFLLLAALAVVLLVASRSNRWLVGIQNEPHWAWAIGSGRLKVWVAEPGAFHRHDSWTSSWYRGLDGQPIRWGLPVHQGSTGGVLVMAVPLWAMAGALAAAGLLLARPILPRAIRVRRAPGHCPVCEYDLRGCLTSGCPECGWGRAAS